LPDPDAMGVQAQIDRLYEEATQATEKYNAADVQKKKLSEQVSNLQEAIARRQADINDLRNALGATATAQYRNGVVTPAVRLFLSSDPEGYLDKAAMLDRASQRQMDLMRQVQSTQRAIDQQRDEATTKLRQLSTTREELKNRKREIQGKLAQARRLLNTLSTEQKAQRAAEQAQANRASERASLGSQTSASRRAAAAFAAAKSRLGMPYVWGAEGPNSFDCSGLTSWAFRQAGVTIPRTSQAQAKVGTRINSLSALRPGDLVVMRNDLSHIGFYAGNGQILHAPKPGASVRYESISRSGMPFMWGVRIG
jgi:cell wall-associated NlpC family hydrolase